jgi:hypothetical protein
MRDEPSRSVFIVLLSDDMLSEDVSDDEIALIGWHHD